MDSRAGMPSNDIIQNHYKNGGMWLIWDGEKRITNMHPCHMKIDNGTMKFKWLNHLWLTEWYEPGVSMYIWLERNYVPLSKDYEFVSWSSLEDLLF